MENHSRAAIQLSMTLRAEIAKTYANDIRSNIIFRYSKVVEYSRIATSKNGEILFREWRHNYASFEENSHDCSSWQAAPFSRTVARHTRPYESRHESALHILQARCVARLPRPLVTQPERCYKRAGIRSIFGVERRKRDFRASENNASVLLPFLCSLLLV